MPSKPACESLKLAICGHAQRLRRANARRAAYPGESDDRQPVHTVYRRRRTCSRRHGAASSARWRWRAQRRTRRRRRRSRRRSASPRQRCRASPKRSARASSTSCEREPIEDFRIDFEDGYGNAARRRRRRPRGNRRREQVAAGHDGRHAAAVHRHPDQADVDASCTRAACARSTSSSPRWSRPARRLPANFAVTVPKVMTPAHVERASPAPARRSSGSCG